MVYKLILILSLLTFVSCNKKGIGDVKRFNDDGDILLVVEIPAGTIQSYEYDFKEKGFKNRVENGIDRTIGYLPNPFNLGFIPPFKDNNKTEVVILSESYSIGTLLPGEIIGALEYESSGNLKYLYIANPKDYKYKFNKDNDLSQVNEVNVDIIEVIKHFISKSKHYKFTNNILSANDANKKLRK